MASRLHSNEREDKAKDEGEQSLPDIHMELGCQNGAAHDGGGTEAKRPPESRDTVRKRRLVLVVGVEFLVGTEPPEGVQVEAACLAHAFDNGAQADEDVDEGVDQHNHHTRPKEPVTGRRASGVFLGVVKGNTNIGDQGKFVRSRCAKSKTVFNEGGGNYKDEGELESL